MSDYGLGAPPNSARAPADRTKRGGGEPEKVKLAAPGDPFAFTFVKGNAPVELSDDEDMPPKSEAGRPTGVLPPPRDKMGPHSAIKGKESAATNLHVRFPSEGKLCQVIPGAEDEKFVLFQALYDYHSSDPDDLSFQANDILRVTDQGEGPQSWFYGETQDGREGHFPGTFVRKIPMLAKKLSVDVENDVVTHEPAPTPAPAARGGGGGSVAAASSESYVLYQTLFDYKSEDPDDLCFRSDEIIRVTDEGDGPQSWFYGQSQDGREGSFPGTFVRKIRMPSANAVKQVEGLDHLT